MLDLAKIAANKADLSVGPNAKPCTLPYPDDSLNCLKEMMMSLEHCKLPTCK